MSYKYLPVRLMCEGVFSMHYAKSVNYCLFTSDLDMNYFWRWTHFSDYCLFIAMFSLVGLLVTTLMFTVTAYVELLGFASLLMEACLGFPQFWRNLTNKSTEGMRYTSM